MDTDFDKNFLIRHCQVAQFCKIESKKFPCQYSLVFIRQVMDKYGNLKSIFNHSVFQTFIFAILITFLLTVSYSGTQGNDTNGKDTALKASLLAASLSLNGQNNNRGGGTTLPTDPVSDTTAPSVQRNSTYTVSKTTHVYAQALSHSNWGTATTTVIDLSLDLFLPENAPTNRPAMILIHGGGFYTGSKEDTNIVEMANYFSSRGWVCISINYRLAAARGTLSTAWGNYVLNNNHRETEIENKRIVSV